MRLAANPHAEQGLERSAHVSYRDHANQQA